MNATAPTEPQTKMTMRVYRVNREGTVVEDRGTVSIRHDEQPAPDMPLPPCTCRRCRDGQAEPSEEPALGTASMRAAATWLLDQPAPMGRETVKLFAEDFRRFLWQLIPLIEQLVGPLPKDDAPAQVALAAIGEARRRLAAIDGAGGRGEIERVSRSPAPSSTSALTSTHSPASPAASSATGRSNTARHGRRHLSVIW